MENSTDLKKRILKMREAQHSSNDDTNLNSSSVKNYEHNDSSKKKL
jgi:hypothetical protein